MKNNIIVVVLIILVSFASFFGGIKYSTTNKSVDTKKIDTIAARIDTIYSHTTDTIRVLKYKKELADANFSKESGHLYSIKKDTAAIKKQFDSVFVKTKVDSNTSVGYSQIFGALLVNDKYVRDSTKLLLTDTQLTVCEHGLDSIHTNAIRLADTAKKVAIEQYKKGYGEGKANTTKTLLTSVIISILLGFGIGAYAVH